ncbi:2-aminoethylphosphonate--pyruvate transaminase [Bradyrhizobium sp. BRP22]|uniref:2-aminoethylphosphonate--pyruvate transaminase n=1 Tax=Bradyrhizobium sp. BRP22 TaxID=2793821 RepID=UPI001CD72E86|nr:2-aminoethylphosphonate--pyruvate transaminase [Bradyrhizobium sp. BRP22]MCA1455828.1 2-aminoethylphosphonate--pyruvate transaminase [Bradyrhizobium sp. BRP22]
MEDNVAKQHRSLLTPGPMSLSSAVKAQMQFDLASRDVEFKELTARMRRLVLNLSGNAEHYSVVPIQGGGSFGMEAALSSFVSHADKPLVCINGIYGERILKILRLWGVPAVKLVKRATEPLDPEEVAECLSQDQAITHVCFVHCETTTGILNPLEAIVESAGRRGVKTIVDGMSSFGGIKINLSRGGPDVLVTSSNKCIEGPPGVAFVIASRELLENAGHAPRSFVLDVRDQWLSFERTGEWRSTPPTHIVQAATKALEILGDEGIDCRRRRYEKIRDNIIRELEGVVPPLLSAHLQSPICVAFTAPPGISDQAAFDGLYSFLAAHNLYVYSKLHLPTRSFRIGCIGEIQSSWIEQLGCALRTFFRSGGNNLPGRVSARETSGTCTDRSRSLATSSRHPFATETAVLHAGYRRDPTTKAVAVPIYQNTAYELDGDLNHIADVYNVKADGFTYTRIINPTTRALERRYAAVDMGRDSLAVASGQAATFLAIANLSSGEVGDNVVASPYLYGNTWNLLHNTLRRLGIGVRTADPRTPESFEAAIDDRTICLFGEVISNPCLVPLPVKRLAEIGKKHGIPLVVDNTTTPLVCRPSALGAAITTYSATKYICGHGTTLGGLIVDNGEFDYRESSRFPLFNNPDDAHGGIVWRDALRDIDDLGQSEFLLKARMTWLRDTGGAIAPFASFQLIQGLETLHLRMRQHCANAEVVAEFLQKHPKVHRVFYPGLFEGADREIIDQTLDTGYGYGAMVMFEVENEQAGRKFIQNVDLMYHVSNVGDARTLVTHPVSTTHTTVPREKREAAGIFGGSIRLCVGIEDINDIINDLDKALSAI